MSSPVFGSSLVNRSQVNCRSFDRRCCGTLRCIVRVRAQKRHHEERPVFQLDSRHNLTFEDVRDAYEVCSLIPDPSERGQCYSVFGIDAQRMNNYFETVSQLEGQLTSDFQQGAALSSPPGRGSSSGSSSHVHQAMMTGSHPPPPAAAAAVAVAMLWIASQHLVFF